MKRFFSCFVVMLAFIFTLTFTGCYYDKASLVYPSCDTTNIQLSTDLHNIMSVSCFSCHSAANAPIRGANYNLEDYNTIKKAAADSTLIGTIKQLKGYNPMPQTGAKLSDCSISKFEAWINAGAQNN